MSALPLLVALALFVAPQQPLVIAGSVTTDTGVPVAGATVSGAGVRTLTAADGRFTLSIPSTGRESSVTVVVTASGYLDETLTVRPDAPAGLAVTLRANPRFREELIVSAGSETAAAAPPTLTVSPNVVLSVPGAVDNVFRALQTLPGVSGTEDFGSRLAVRGGGPDENLTVMDGVEIHNPYRLFGLTSAFNPETIDRFELTPGGFGAQYGDRLSSIFVVNNRAGTTREALAGSAALSATDANLVFEGRLPRSLPGSWIVTGRRTYYDVFAERVTDNDLPSFDDLQTKIVLTPGAGRELAFFGLRSREATDAEFEGDIDGDRIGLENRSRNDVVSVSASTPIGRVAQSRTVVAWYRFGDDLDVDGSIRNEAIRSNQPDDESFDRAAIVFTRSVGVRDVSLRQNVTFAPGRRQTIDAGVEWHELRTSWGWTISGDRNTSAPNGSSVIGGTGLPELLTSAAKSRRIGAWVEDAIDLTPRLHVVVGARLDWDSVTGTSTASPRTRLVLDVTPTLKVRLAAGRYTQSPGYEKLLQSDYFVDLTGREGVALTPEQSDHFVAGVEHALGNQTSLRIEMYRKRFRDLVVGRLETPAETSARVAEYDFPADLGWSVPAEPEITTIPINGASGSAFGMDFYLERRARAVTDRVSGWIAYTWGKSTIEQYGASYPSDYDRRHSLSVVSTWRIWPRVSLGATLRVASGFPETLPVDVRVASSLRDGAASGSPKSLVPGRDQLGNLLWTVNYGGVPNLNRGRLPLYARLDLRATYQRSPESRWQFYVEVINALNRDNAGSLSPRLEYDETADRPRVTLESDGGLPLLPSFGLRFRF